jgi:hypothetical protein
MVKISLDSVCFQNQVLVRMGKDFLVGVVSDPDRQGFYVWQEVAGVYQYIGDATLAKQKDGSVIWHVYVSTDTSPEFQRRAAQFLAAQGELHASDASTGNHMDLLSIASEFLG